MRWIGKLEGGSDTTYYLNKVGVNHPITVSTNKYLSKFYGPLEVTTWDYIKNLNYDWGYHWKF